MFVGAGEPAAAVGGAAVAGGGAGVDLPGAVDKGGHREHTGLIRGKYSKKCCLVIYLKIKKMRKESAS